MSGSQGRSRSGNRFYNPPAVRRQLQLQQQQQQQQQQQLLVQKQKQEKLEKEVEKENELQKDKQKLKQQRSQRSPIHRTKSSADSENRTDSDDCASSTTATATATAPTPPPSVSASTLGVRGGGVGFSNLTNLERFLEYTTPQVRAQHFPKTSMRTWRKGEDKFQHYFLLGDLWEAFKEWSAYGAGVPLLLNGSDIVVQYYVPYLSGIQLYIDPSVSTPRSRRLGEDSDADSSRGSSDGSSDCEAVGCLFQGVWSQQDLIECNRKGIKGLSIRNQPLNGSSSDEGEYGSFPGVLKFEYLEHDIPYSREPLADKISLLSSRFPGLKSYRSCDLSPASWISVAWYPIYRIPTGPTLQNLDSCFLTFHSLSTPVRGIQNEWLYMYGSCPREVRSGFDMSLKLALPIFGLAFYKFKTSFWDQTGGDECEKADLLLQAADKWLQLLNVNHPDYQFFASHNCYWK